MIPEGLVLRKRIIRIRWIFYFLAWELNGIKPESRNIIKLAT